MVGLIPYAAADPQRRSLCCRSCSPPDSRSRSEDAVNPFREQILRNKFNVGFNRAATPAPHGVFEPLLAQRAARCSVS
jgi:hypothetical protein